MSRSKSKNKRSGKNRMKLTIRSSESKAPEKEIRALAHRLEKVMLELKYFAQADATYSSVSYNGTDFVQQLTPVPQGDTDNQRDGDQITLESIEFRLGIKVSTTTPTFLRVILFQWKPATTPVYANILQDQHNTSLAALASYNHDTRQLYHVLFDRLVEIDTVARPGHVVHCHISKGFSQKLQFIAGSTTVGTNQIWLMAVSDVLSAGPQCVLYTKVTYNDG